MCFPVLLFNSNKILILLKLLFETNIRSKQCTEAPTRAELVGQHPKPFNNFREIGYAP